MKKGLFLFTLLIVAGISSCKDQPKQTTEAVSEKNEVVANSALVPEKWISSRVAKAKNRLQGSEAGSVIWNAMEAHGGLSKWFSNGALAFRFNYQPLDGKTARDSYQIVDVWRNRAVHTSVSDSTAKFGWNGKTAWVKAKDSTAFAYDTKFWALTPIYLFAHPFVLDGEGVNLELLPQAKYKEKTNDVVKVTFDAGTGDAPDDYYILHFDVDTHLITAIRYIVSYPEYFKDGGHNPEKFMEVGELVNIEGILLPTGLKTHWTVENGQPGDYITKIDVSDLHFIKTLENDFYDVPEGAKILE
ncbi:hypothetical protein [uncultured Kriegella sp.]|uniref:hypothetical protein n=1 Tax=uncultured Kriegella sp. TaxID=1798910 RepID=UPI0030D934EB|tara:strand:+ start:138738 stop:139640 length:903 start_codon:yes stop_codon:yes gene_type:complete